MADQNPTTHNARDMTPEERAETDAEILRVLETSNRLLRYQGQRAYLVPWKVAAFPPARSFTNG